MSAAEWVATATEYLRRRTLCRLWHQQAVRDGAEVWVMHWRREASHWNRAAIHAETEAMKAVAQ